MDATEAARVASELQAATDALWGRILPVAGPQALRVFTLRSVLDRSDASPWLRQLRFYGDGRPVWTSIQSLVRGYSASRFEAVVADVISAIAVKAIEQFGDLPVRNSGLNLIPPGSPSKRAA
jgi:hypothetical protein